MGNVESKDTCKDREVNHGATWAKAWRSAPTNTLKGEGAWSIPGMDIIGASVPEQD